MHLHPKEYLKKAQKLVSDGASKTDAEKILQEIDEIVMAKERGLKMLKKLGREPEKSVLDNKKILEEARALLGQLS